MSGLVLELQTAPWREHLQRTLVRYPGLVPVAKGNGYGFGLARLADETNRLGLVTLAVGTVFEVEKVRAGGFTGDIVVLTPWRPGNPLADALLTDSHVITTVSRLDDLTAISMQAPHARVLIEVLTSMRRHGIAPGQCKDAAAIMTPEGWSIHLPLEPGRLDEARELSLTAVDAHAAPVWLSHLSADEYRTLNAELPVDTRMRVGTKLWLGAPETRRITAEVQDIHAVHRGMAIGYHQRKPLRDGWLVVVAGGTAHGIGLEAPKSPKTLKHRLRILAKAPGEAAGLPLSPFTIGGKKRFFAEPPHMQASLLFLPGAHPGVRVGDRATVTARMTTTSFDELIEV